MKRNVLLSWITFVYLLLNTWILYDYYYNSQGGVGIMHEIIILPIFWSFSVIIIGVIAVRKRKVWFSRQMVFSTILLLLLCTPLLSLVFFNIVDSDIKRSSSNYNTSKGHTIKTETWVYESGRVAIIKFWKLEQENYLDAEASEFKKDSTWIYLSEEGDTTKKEVYFNDKLIEVVEGDISD